MWPHLVFLCEHLANFYSHIPCGMWRIVPSPIKHTKAFLLTHPVWDVTAERKQITAFIHISTHTSRVGCDRQRLHKNISYRKFLLTHPVWDVTKTVLAGWWRQYHFYSHIPCGMWHLSFVDKMVLSYFYSHIPCGMWLRKQADAYGSKKFLLTHPVWDVTLYPLINTNFHENFYSHIPCGMWRYLISTGRSDKRFLLTHPVWDVTKYFLRVFLCQIISTHTSRVGCDKFYDAPCQIYTDFYSHIPCGMWRWDRGSIWPW